MSDAYMLDTSAPLNFGGRVITVTRDTVRKGTVFVIEVED